jgi:hypothetical protein
VELAYERFVDLAGGEVEPGQIFVDRQVSRLDLISDRPDLAFGSFRLES